MARKISSDTFCYLMPLVNTNESGIAIRSERQRVTETYSYGKEEIHLNNSALIWALHSLRHDRLLTVGELGKYYLDIMTSQILCH